MTFEEWWGRAGKGLSDRANPGAEDIARAAWRVARLEGVLLERRQERFSREQSGSARPGCDNAMFSTYD